MKLTDLHTTMRVKENIIALNIAMDNALIMQVAKAFTRLIPVSLYLYFSAFHKPRYRSQRSGLP